MSESAHAYGQDQVARERSKQINQNKKLIS